MNKTDLKSRILGLARDKFVRLGYKNVKTDEIAKELGISKRTLYQMFDTKNSLLVEALQEPIKEFESSVNEIADKMTDNGKFSFFEHLNKILELDYRHTKLYSHAVYDEIRKYLPEFYNLCKLHDSNKFEKFQRIGQLGIEHGYFREGFDHFLVVHMMHVSMWHLTNPDFIEKIPLSVNQVVSQIYDIILNGLLTDAGRSKYAELIKN